MKITEKIKRFLYVVAVKTVYSWMLYLLTIGSIETYFILTGQISVSPLSLIMWPFMILFNMEFMGMLVMGVATIVTLFFVDVK